MKAKVSLEYKDYISVDADNDRLALKAAEDYLIERNSNRKPSEQKGPTGKITCVHYPLYHVETYFFNQEKTH